MRLEKEKTMKLFYVSTPIPERVRKNPFDLRRKCRSAVHSYRGEDGYEYRKEFFVERDEVLPAPPAELTNGIPLHKQVPGLESFSGYVMQ